jgi:hypothetical protein
MRPVPTHRLTAGMRGAKKEQTHQYPQNCTWIALGAVITTPAPRHVQLAIHLLTSNLRPFVVTKSPQSRTLVTFQ